MSSAISLCYSFLRKCWIGLCTRGRGEPLVPHPVQVTLPPACVVNCRQLSPGNEAVVDEIRTTIRYAAAALLRRAKKVRVTNLGDGCLNCQVARKL